ncbi:MAG: AsmA family protein [Balneolaceae bacterium]|nr:AsmA family protein [Balneolaceae bacterium]MCH8548796.1 AsmA family protein [Balneolaceae bacterium]
MKLFLKIAAGFLIFMIVLIIGLNLYFTDERLKNMILPEVRELTGSEVTVERMSLTFFRTFPRFGVELDELNMPDPDGEPVLSVEELLVSVELRPLFRNELAISRLDITRPLMNYVVYEDSTTNIDFLLELAEDEPEEVEDGFDITIPRFTVRGAGLAYLDQTSDTQIDLADLDADISLRFADLIETTIDARLGSLSMRAGDTQYLENLSLSLVQTSTIDMENEIVTLEEGTFSIRGLALDLTGTIAPWSADEPEVDLQFASSSDNFGELLRLAPPEFDDMLAGLETRGSLRLEGSVAGRISENELPRFDLIIDVQDGYLQNPDLPDAIEDIFIQVEVNNDLATIREFRARAADNTVTATGTLERPLEDDATFSIELDGDVDLATVSRFYPIGDFGIEDLAGVLQANATANGRIDMPEDATFSGTFILSEGLLQYADVPRPIEDINARIDANQDRIRIEESGFRAASNRLTMSGSVLRPLDEDQREIDLSANINFDLASIKEFYPIDEDTLEMRGQLEARIALRGQPDPDQIENLLQQSTIELLDGYLAHRMVARPLEDITLRAEATGTRLNISEGRFRTGENNLSMNGSITRYLSDDPEFDLNFDGNAVLGDIATYYSLEPWIQELSGDAVMSLNARGPAGDPTQIALNGSLEVSNVSARGDSIPLPVTELNGKLSINPEEMTLENFTMKYGSSDINLEGRLQRYLGFLEEEHESEETMPRITGSYHSALLNMDEMIDWDEEADEDPLPINLPNLTGSVDARIDQLIIFDLSVTDISGRGRITPNQIIMDEAVASMYEGKAEGRMEWNVPDPLRTNLRFVGSLTDLRAETFFEETGFLGTDRSFYQYVSGGFSADIDYYTEMDETVTPDIETTVATGSFGMTRANMSGHPIQMRIASFLRASELESVNLDEWAATFEIENSVLTMNDLRLTSDNIGIELDGTQHLVNNEISYTATLLLPERFKSGIASVISSQAAEALQRDDGTLAVPIRITGTSDNPTVRPDTSVIEDVIRDRVRDGASDAIRRLFRSN